VVVEIVTRVLDNLDRTPISDGTGERIVFAYQGREYEMDLNDANAARYHEVMTGYADSATRIGGRGAKAKPAPKSTDTAPRPDRTGIRQWAREHGYTINSYGKLPRDVLDAWDSRDGGDR